MLQKIIIGPCVVQLIIAMFWPLSHQQRPNSAQGSVAHQLESAGVAQIVLQIDSLAEVLL